MDEPTQPVLPPSATSSTHHWKGLRSSEMQSFASSDIARRCLQGARSLHQERRTKQPAHLAVLRAMISESVLTLCIQLRTNALPAQYPAGLHQQWLLKGVSSKSIRSGRIADHIP